MKMGEVAMWFISYTLIGLLPILIVIVVVLYLGNLFAEHRPL
jgi:hypothetical protein